MSKIDRTTLKSRFKTGMRPTQSDFENLIDSQVSGLDDGLSIDPVTKNVGIGIATPKEKLQVGGAITLGTTPNAAPDPGTLKFDAGKFQGWNGTWVDLRATGGGGDTFWKQPVVGTNNINFASGADEIDVNLAVGSKPALALKAHHPVTNVISEFSLTADGLGGQLQLKGKAFLFTGTNNAVFLNISPGDDVVEISTSVGPVVTCAADNVHIPKLETDNFTNNSDVRLKKDIRPFTGGLDLISRLNPVRFSYSGQGGTTEGESHIGLIAQELQQVMPELVETRQKKINPGDEQPTDLLSVRPLELIYLAINSIKELEARVQTLETQLASQRVK